MSTYDHKGDASDTGDDKETSVYFKEITNRFVAYAQKEINAAAYKTFVSGYITKEAKDEFDILIKESMSYLLSKKLIDHYTLDSLYIQGQEKISVDMVVKLPYFKSNVIAVKFSVKDNGDSHINDDNI